MQQFLRSEPSRPTTPPSEPSHHTRRDQVPSEPTLVCATCRHPITSMVYRIEVAGAHRHTFANPHGLVFQIGCFSEATGCRGTGPASDDFTWFSGYEWQVGVCARCGIHLGWRFISHRTSFFGLIVDRLRDTSLHPSQQP